jgi:putative membrane protein
VTDGTFEPDQRLHPTSWLFAVFAFVRQLIVPLAAAAFFGSRDGNPTWLWPVAAVILAAALWKQWFYRYGLGPTGLVIREGLFFRNVRQIDYARIENIDTERSLLHRLLGVAEVRVETSTGGKAEASIQVLGLAAAEELRERVFAARGGEAREHTARKAEDVLLAMSTAEVVKFGLIDNRGLIVVAGVVGFLYEAGVMEVWSAVLRAAVSPELMARLIARGMVIQIALMLIVLLGAVLVLRVLSVALALFTFHGFTLTRVDNDLRTSYGLLTRLSLTLRLQRIQAAHVTQTLLHRVFDRVAVRVDLAGGGASPEAQQQGRGRVRWLAPLAAPNRARELIARALPDVDFTRTTEWQPLSPRAYGRVMRKSAALWSVVGLGFAVMLHALWPFLLIAVGVPISMCYAAMYVRYTRWALQDDALFFRRGWLTRKLVIVPRNRVQVVCLGESPFDRRYRMASLRVDTAGAASPTDQIRIPYLDLDVARELARALETTAAAQTKAAPAEVAGT